MYEKSRKAKRCYALQCGLEEDLLVTDCALFRRFVRESDVDIVKNLDCCCGLRGRCVAWRPTTVAVRGPGSELSDQSQRDQQKTRFKPLSRLRAASRVSGVV
jgi:hypothetical protein